MFNTDSIVNVLHMTMDIDGLAAILHTTTNAIRTKLSRHPESLPRPLKLEHNTRLIWLTKDVEAWLEAARQPSIPRPEITQEKKRVGRPPKRRMQTVN